MATSKVENVTEAVTSFRLAFQTVRDLNGKNEICRAQLFIVLSLSPLAADEISDDISRWSAVNFFAFLQLLSAKPTNVEAQPTSWRLTFAKREAVAKDFLEAIIYTSRLFEKNVFSDHTQSI